MLTDITQYELLILKSYICFILSHVSLKKPGIMIIESISKDIKTIWSEPSSILYMKYDEMNLLLNTIVFLIGSVYL